MCSSVTLSPPADDHLVFQNHHWLHAADGSLSGLLYLLRVQNQVWLQKTCSHFLQGLLFVGFQLGFGQKLGCLLFVFRQLFFADSFLLHEIRQSGFGNPPQLIEPAAREASQDGNGFAAELIFITEISLLLLCTCFLDALNFAEKLL